MTNLPETELVRLLSVTDAYAWPVVEVEHLQTHISHLFFAGDRVVKVKRPVDYGFANLTTLASRARACRDEVRLNRRLTDDIYLDALPISRHGDGVRLGGDGDPIEWATVMRRFPKESALDHILAAGAAPVDLIDRLANRLIPFHTSLPPCPGSPEELAESAERILRENLAEIAAIGSSAVYPYEFNLIRKLIEQQLADRPDAILERAQAGYIREGHGDLKCEHMLLDPPGSLQIFDCVEFSLQIRCADIASDLAFLLLDLERLGAGDVGAELVERYRSAGLDLPGDQLTLYKLHRGLVKVKTAALTSPTPHHDPAREVVTWLHHVFRTAFELSPIVIAMTGYSGSGKSVVAREIADMTGAKLLSTDAIRRTTSSDRADRYSPASRLANYQALVDRAAPLLASGVPVILDGTFLGTEERTLAADFAAEHATQLVFVEVTADRSVMERRIAARSAGESPAYDSEATFSVLEAQRSTEPAPFPASAMHVKIENSTDSPASIDPLLRALTDLNALAPRTTPSA